VTDRVTFPPASNLARPILKSGTNIERRGSSGVLYFRRAVPNDLRAKGAPRDLRLSLRTNIRSEAIVVARQLNVLVDHVFDQIRQGRLDMSALNNLSLAIESEFKREMFLHHVGAVEETKARAGRVSPEQAAEFARLAQENARRFKEALALNDNELAGRFVPREIERQNLGVAPDMPAWSRLMLVGKQVMQQVYLAEARRWDGDHDDTPTYRALSLAHPSDLPATTQPPAVLSPQAKRPLSAIYEECKAHQLAHSTWKGSTVTSKDVSVRLFQEVVGNLRLDLITADHAAAFDRALREIPAMVGRSIYKGLAAPEAIERLKALRADIERRRDARQISIEQANLLLAEPKCQRMEPHTRNKHINAMASIVTWARRTMKWTLEDHFAPFRMTRLARRRQPRKRIRLTLPRLLEILQSPRFSGCKSDKSRFQTVPGNVVVKDGLYWSVLLEACQGCRLDEGAKLRTIDISGRGGMWWLKLNFDGDDEGRGETEAGSGKNDASKRVVPMHRVLIQLGLPEHATRMAEYHKQKGSKPEECWLFPELTVSKHHRTRSANLTKRWATYLRTAGLYRRWEDGHALRHTFNDTLLRAGVPEALIKELMGHSRRDDMTEDTYLTPSTLRQMKQALDKLDYGLPLELRDGEWQIARPVRDKP
jgi:hypothetical protein